MLSLATSKSKKPSAQPPDPNIRLSFGETAARRSFFFACGILANVYSASTLPLQGGGADLNTSPDVYDPRVW